MTLTNAQGDVYYGLHFYPGVAEYQAPGGEAYRVFLNEDTLRKMDPTFAGKPIFVEHVDDVDQNLDQLRKEADGWVIESFFNAADGKHWAKFIIVSEHGKQAIERGYKLSNAYFPSGSFGPGGLWNGVAYAKQIMDGTYEHLAIVQNPRYEESEILTPAQFKKYNEDHIQELKRIANSQKGDSRMKLNFFKKSKVENAVDFADLSVILPKSQKEKTLVQIINAMDDMEMKDSESQGQKQMANMDHRVKMNDGSECSVGDLMKKHQALHDELQSMKKDDMESESEVEMKKEPIDVEGDLSKNVDDEGAKEKALQLAEHEEKEIEAAKKKNDLELKKAKDKEKADRLRNAHLNAKLEASEPVTIDLSADKVARGKQRYGS